MNLKNVGMATLIGLTLGLTGCGYSCEDFCEDGADCPGSEVDPDDCSDDCEDVEELNEAAGCEDEFDEMLECVGDQDDFCDDAEDCGDEFGDWFGCVVEWCYDHPDARECR